MAAQDNIDTRAIELARDALSRIEAHERVCEERWREQRGWVHELAEKMDKMDDTMRAGFERLREVVGAKVAEVHDRVDAIEKDAAREARTEARTARGLFDSIVARVLLALVGLGLAAVGGMQVRL